MEWLVTQLISSVNMSASLCQVLCCAEGKAGNRHEFLPLWSICLVGEDKKQGECVLLDGDQVLGENSKLGQGGKCWQYASGKWLEFDVGWSGKA